MEPRIKKVWLAADSVVSPLGTTSEENFRQVLAGASGVAESSGFSDSPVHLSHIANLESTLNRTRFEQLVTQAIDGLKKQVKIPSQRTLFILSTTKGNIEVMGQSSHPRIQLHAVASLFAKELAIEKSIVVSNACTSGVVALLVGKRYIESGEFDHAVVVGADVLSKFVVTGFQSLQATSPTPCKPFDLHRAGINLGEAASAVLLTAKPEDFGAERKILILGGGMSNDANHISGPSKTGEELALAIKSAIVDAGIGVEEIDLVSAHGTGTRYNDEMEAKAFHFSSLQDTPVHSLKGNFGHTLGAAGVLETVMCAHGLKHGKLFPTHGFETNGVTKPLNIIKLSKSKKLRVAMKSASGFGGCNAALVMALTE
jgi:3-oxoacyl-[acyl-carrier-protein] synthase I